jgi:hypothetical protein
MSNTDETKQFDLKWKEIYTSGIEKVFLFAENKQNFKFPQNEYIKLYSYSIDLNLVKLIIYVLQKRLLYIKPNVTIIS